MNVSWTWQRVALLIVLGYEALGALLGGILLVVAPDGHYMDMPVEIMNGVFGSFLVPGIILLCLGILQVFAFFSVLRRSAYDWIISSLALGCFIIWFVVEIIILRELHWLHLMWGIPVLLGAILTIPLFAFRNNTITLQRELLFCGAISSLWYIAINIFVPTLYDGYSVVSHTVSELSAIHSPARIDWILLVFPYPLLFSAFGWAVLFSAEGKRSLRVVGYLIVVYSVLNLYWPPMHMRGNEHSLTDTLHIVWAAITNIFMWIFMVMGAFALDKKFRVYTFISILLHIIFGILTLTEAPNIPKNGPTPLIGLWERVNILIFMVWVMVFSILLIRKTRKLQYATEILQSLKKKSYQGS